MSGLYRVAFFFVTSYVAAVGGYYLLLAIRPDYPVFGSLFRMFLYHEQYPTAYIKLVCGVFSLLATLGVGRFAGAGVWERLVTTAGITSTTILISCPLGGVLWQYHDIISGFWPGAYGWKKLFVLGPTMGLKYGWLIILFSFPYNVLGVLVCYVILWLGSNLERVGLHRR